MSRIARIKSAIRPHVLTLCRQWLPKGVVRGRWYMVCSPFRHERTPSFGVCLDDGGFHDFGAGDNGDIIDLCMRLHGVTLSEAIEAFEQMLGIENSAKSSARKSEGRAGQAAEA